MTQAKVKITTTDKNGSSLTQYIPPNEVEHMVKFLRECGYTKVITEYHSND